MTILLMALSASAGAVIGALLMAALAAASRADDAAGRGDQADDTDERYEPLRRASEGGDR